MPYPGRLRSWIDSDPTHQHFRQFRAYMEAVFRSESQDEVPVPEVLSEWMAEDGLDGIWSGRIVRAFVAGIEDRKADVGIPEGAPERGYEPRSAEGDAYECGWEFADYLMK